MVKLSEEPKAILLTPERLSQIEELYHSARAWDPHQRPVLLAAACQGDEELRREVESLLAAEPAGECFLDEPVMQQAAGMFEPRQTGTQQWLAPGKELGPYAIESRLGAGGMGVVYRALDRKLGRLVALKFLPPHLSHDSELRKRLSDEARAASALDHPNIVVVHAIDETPEGDLFIAMAYHEGVTLREKIASGLTVKEALQIARQIASGLAAAHEHGIFHRDIKPSNVMVAKDGVARIIDFGLARSGDVTVTTDGSTRGTPLYMSPEQATGKSVDSRTDLWSLGAVLYEMLAGKPPFQGETQVQVLRAVTEAKPPALGEARPGLPPDVEAIVTRALEKVPAKRYQSAAEMVDDLTAALVALEAPTRARSGIRMAYALPAAILVLIAAGAAAWLYQRSEKRLWAREQAIPEIESLMNRKRSMAAFQLLRQAQRYLPGDPQLAHIAEGVTNVVSIRSSPPGASVEIKDYLSPEDQWVPLGKTPLDKIAIPAGYLRWKVSKPGFTEYTGAPNAEDLHGFLHQFDFTLDAASATPEGMVLVPAGQYDDYIYSIGELGPYRLPAFYLDRFEVTNRQYQEFVDKGGYRKREYWKEKFVRDGGELSWEQAMDLLRDTTGRPGPATWEAGHYPAGEADYPVGGVSWYEASAYAEFAGKSLPAISQWFLAAPSRVAKYILAVSNFSASPAPVGKYSGLGPWGTYDMAGNVAEWCRNESGDGTRYFLGGAWNTTTSEYFGPITQPPFYRAPNSGFRCVRNSAPLPAEAILKQSRRIADYSNLKPASEEIFRAYKAMYAYDRTPLNAKVEGATHDSADWSKEKITFDAAYGGERMTAYLFLPARVRPPYQTVIFFPSARVLDIASSQTLGDMKFMDYVIRSGRAVLYPVYKGTYERPGPGPGMDTAAGRENLIQDSKDLGRSLDYLETRTDIDRNRIGYLGISMGAALGVNFAGVEDRFKALVWLDGGFYSEQPLPGTSQADFAPHVKAPTLLISGKFDWIYSGKDALLQILGTPAADKKGIVFETAHDVAEQRADMVREVLGWLDKYLGKVN